MVLFLLVAVPLMTAIGLEFLSQRERPGDEVGAPQKPIVKGIVWFFPIALLVVGYRLLMPLKISLEGLFWYFLIGDHLGLATMVTGVAVIANRSGRKRTTLGCHREYLLFFAVVFSLMPIVDLAFADAYWSLYETVTRPLLRVAVVVAYPAVITLAEKVAGGGWWLGVLLVIPGLSALSAALSEWNRPFYGLILAVLIAVGAVAGVLAWYLYNPRERAKRRLA